MSMSPPPPPGPPPGQGPYGFEQPGLTPPGFQPYGGPQVGPPRNAGMAVAALVLSLVGLIPCFWLFQIPGLLGTIFGFVGMSQTKDGTCAWPGYGDRRDDHRRHLVGGVRRLLDLLRPERRLCAHRYDVGVHHRLM